MPTTMTDDPRHNDIIIIGAGVIGLSIGWQAAQAGMRVRVLDAHQAGSGATHAAAGMLAARVEGVGNHRDMRELLMRSRDLWPDFATSLGKASGMDIGYRRQGTLLTAFDRDEREQLEWEFPPESQDRANQDRAVQNRAIQNIATQDRATKNTAAQNIATQDEETRHLTPDAAYLLESALAPGLLAAVFSPHDHSVDGRKLAQALKQALLRAGGQCLENHPVDEIIIKDGCQHGIRVHGRVLRAKILVLSAGAWSAKISGMDRSRLGGIRPVKGQVVALTMPQRPLITRVVWGHGCYLVPHDDGRLLIGSTLEERGFDTKVTVDGIHFLLDRARRILPGIDPCAVDDIWSGVRPASDDGLPLLGPLSPQDYQGVIVATGHYRNGILLAPLTARIILDCLRGEGMGPKDQAYAAMRFAPDIKTDIKAARV